jgi:hypothetical protein
MNIPYAMPSFTHTSETTCLEEALSSYCGKGNVFFQKNAMEIFAH